MDKIAAIDPRKKGAAAFDPTWASLSLSSMILDRFSPAGASALRALENPRAGGRNGGNGRQAASDAPWSSRRVARRVQ
jgi:hypothetical protein